MNSAKQAATQSMSFSDRALNTHKGPPALSEGGGVVCKGKRFAILPEILEHAATHGAGKTITFPSSDGADLVWSYVELLSAARRIHSGLKAIGLRPGAKVILQLEKNHEILPALWGCLLGGFVPLIMDVPTSFERSNRAFEHLCYMSGLLGGPLLLTDSALLPGCLQVRISVPDVGVRVACVSDFDGSALELQYHEAQPTDIAFLCFTSGSTGVPKCIQLTHHCVIRRNEGVNQHNSHRSDDVNLNWLPFDHIGSITEHIRSMQLACSLVYVHKDRILARPLEMLDIIDRYRITHTWGPNFIYALIFDALGNSAEQRTWDLSSVRFLISGGEAASFKMMEGFLERTKHWGFPATGFRPSFGMVELSAGITYYAPTADEPLGFYWLARAGVLGEAIQRVEKGHPGATIYGNLGKPVAGCKIRVIDQRGHLLPEQTVGRVQIGGEPVAHGYLGNEELTKAVFLEDGWLETGDLGFLVDGNLVLTGRIKEMLIINGVNYYSREIEDMVEALEGVEVSFTAACAVKPSSDEPEQLAIFFHTPHESADEKRDVVKRIRQTLVSRAHVNPSYIVAVAKAEIPKTPIGKIKRLELTERFQRGEFAAALKSLDDDRAKVAPRNSLEKTMVEIWTDVLRVEVGVEDNFFECGGDSIKAVMVMNQVRDKLRVHVAPAAIFHASTIAELAHALSTGAFDDSSVRSFDLTNYRIVADVEHRHEPFPLTDIQQAYWAGRNPEFELGGRSVHAYEELEGIGIDIARLNRAWNCMIARHEMLRTVILADGTQQILSTIPHYSIDVSDFRALGQNDSELAIQTIRDRMSHHVLPCDTWPSFEIHASLLPENRCRLHFSLDAVFLDARSRYILYSEFGAFYRDPDAVLPPLEMSFRDYVLREEEIKHSAQFDPDRAYWLNLLPNLPAAPDMPLAAHPSTLREPKFFQHAHFFSKPAWQALKKLASKSRLTASGLLLTVFSDVLRVWNKRDRFTINITVYRRLPLHDQVNDIIGDFTTLLLMEIDEPGDVDFVGRAMRLQKRMLEHLNHTSFSGVQVLRELAKLHADRSAAQMPVVFTSVLGDEIRDTNEGPLDWLGTMTHNVTQTPQIWFDHVAFEEGGGLSCRWNVVEGLFPKGLMNDVFESYIGHLERLGSEDRAWSEPWCETARYLIPNSQRERRRLYNATTSPIPSGLLHTPFAERAALHPKHAAIISSARVVDYGTLQSISNHLGHQLRNMGALPNTLVAVAMEKGWEQVAAVLGILVAGAAYLPVDPNLPEERFRLLLECGQVKIVLTQPHLKSLLPLPSGIDVLCVDESMISAESVVPLVPRQTADDLAYVIFTSGSTGQPKGVMIDHRGALNTILDVNNRFNVSVDDRVLALSALSFDLSVYDIFGLLSAGGTIVMPNPADVREPARWYELVQMHGVTIWNTVPAFVGVLMDYASGRPPEPLASLRLVMMSGDWIPVSLPERIEKSLVRPKIISMGGATEASIWSILHPIDAVDPTWKSIPYGRPMINQSIHVLNSALEPVPEWMPGMIFIGGIGLAKGYWRDEEKTNASFFVHSVSGERLYRTGDMGRFVPMSDGHPSVEFLGREDNQVKIQGFRVELGEIEAALAEHPGLKQAVVEARGARHAEKQLVAYILPTHENSLSADVVKRHLQSKLPAYMIPTRYVFLREMPLSANGKIDRKALPAPEEPAIHDIGGVSASTSHDGHLLQRLASIVAQILGRPNVAPQESLFELGATSIHMMRIVNAIEKEFSVRMPIGALYEHPTVLGLVEAYVGMQRDMGIKSSPSDAGFNMSPSMLQRFPYLSDHDDRERFKAQQVALRHLDAPQINLDQTLTDDVARILDTRCSHRHFSDKRITIGDFSRFMSCLRRFERDGKARYLYGSAGGLYPVQTYVYVKPNRIEGLDGGTYYHHPVDHRLARLSTEELDERIYNPHINRPVWREAAFAIFLVADLRAIVPMYREQSLQFSALEAGLVSQLLEMHAPTVGLGLCQIGELQFDRIRSLLQLENDHVLVHSLLGGIPSEGARERTWSEAKGLGEIIEQTRELEEF